MAVIFEGEICQLVDVQHHKPGKGGAYVRTRIKVLRTGVAIDRTFRAGEKVFEEAFLEARPAKLLYKSADEFTFMDDRTFEQLTFTAEQVGDAAGYITEDASVTLSMHKDALVEVVLTSTVRLKVVETAAGLRGDTAKGGTKPAKVETGRTVQVPLFVKEGDMIMVDTRTGEYAGRA